MSITKTVLVTGSHGFIGRSTVAELESNGWSVTKTTRNKSEASSSQVTLDLSKPETILDLFQQTRFDAIVHLAANVDLKTQAIGDLFPTNVTGTSLLLDGARKCGAYFVFASTCIIHGIRSTNITSDSPINLDSAYAHSKWLGEKLVEASGVPFTILRIPGVFGSNGPAHLGLNRTIMNAARGETPTLMGSGAGQRNYIYVNDMAKHIRYALDNKLNGTHFVGASETLSLKSMLQQICDVFLPGQAPRLTGGEAKVSDQIVEASTRFPKTRSFVDALKDIQSKLPVLNPS